MNPSPLYMCAFHNNKEDKWYHSKQTDKKEAIYFMEQIANLEKDVDRLMIVKVIEDIKFPGE